MIGCAMGSPAVTTVDLARVQFATPGGSPFQRRSWQRRSSGWTYYVFRRRLGCGASPVA
jgi:hypothetical protein